MAKTQFELESYAIRLGGTYDHTYGHTTIQVFGFISCVGPDFMLNVYFLADGSPVPPAHIDSDLTSGVLFLQKDMMPLWIDLLRHESPMWVSINTDSPESTRISTSAESIGEDEN